MTAKENDFRNIKHLEFYLELKKTNKTAIQNSKRLQIPGKQCLFSLCPPHFHLFMQVTTSAKMC